jgi:hypothetical protein
VELVAVNTCPVLGVPLTVTPSNKLTFKQFPPDEVRQVSTLPVVRNTLPFPEAGFAGVDIPVRSM